MLAQPDLKLVRSDPNLDPSGYYTLFVCQLAEQFYGVPGLKQQVLGTDTNPQQVGSPSVAALMRGEIDAAFFYLNGAADANVPYLTLPDELNLSNPAYAAASYTTPNGQTFRGSPIYFSVAPLLRGANPEGAAQFIAYLLTPPGQALIAATHFLPNPVLLGGDQAAAPDAVRQLGQGMYPG